MSIPYDNSKGYIQTIESLRIPIITDADKPKQCFYLSHDELTVTIAIPSANGNQIGFRFPKIATGEQIEQSLVGDVMRMTEHGKKFHQGRIDELLEQMRRMQMKSDEQWVDGFSAGAEDARVTCSLRYVRDMALILLFGLALGGYVAYFATHR